MNLHFLVGKVKIFGDILGIYLLWILVFYASSHLHVYFCTPNGLYGLLMSPVLSQTPHCNAIRWLLYHGSLHINTFWTIVASMFIKHLAYQQRIDW